MKNIEQNRTWEFQIEYDNEEISQKKYVYNFNYLTVEQVEPVIAIGKFHEQQTTQLPDSHHRIIKSRGHEWISEIMKYILLEIVDGDRQKYSNSNIESTKEFIKSLPATEWIRLEECVINFFINTGQLDLALELQQPEKKRVSTQPLLRVLEKVMEGQILKNGQKGSSKSSLPLTMESSKDVKKTQ